MKIMENIEIMGSLILIIRNSGNISDVARKSNITRQTIYNMIYQNHIPNLDTIIKLSNHLGYRLKLEKIE